MGRQRALNIRPFEHSDFEEYRSWYRDEVLDEALGPMDEEWLDAVLAESPPAQFSLLSEGELCAVVGIARPSERQRPFVITDLAVRPDLRGNGMGRRALAALFRHLGAEAGAWVAYVGVANEVRSTVLRRPRLVERRSRRNRDVGLSVAGLRGTTVTVGPRGTFIACAMSFEPSEFAEKRKPPVRSSTT